MGSPCSNFVGIGTTYLEGLRTRSFVFQDTNPLPSDPCTPDRACSIHCKCTSMIASTATSASGASRTRWVSVSTHHIPYLHWDLNSLGAAQHCRCCEGIQNYCLKETRNSNQRLWVQPAHWNARWARTHRVSPTDLAHFN